MVSSKFNDYKLNLIPYINELIQAFLVATKALFQNSGTFNYSSSKSLLSILVNICSNKELIHVSSSFKFIST